MKVYTKTGDKGMTSLIGGERVFKTDERVEAYGSVDELSAFAALLTDRIRGDAALAAYVEDLNRILSRLMSVEALLATGEAGSDKVSPLAPEAVSWLESRIDTMQAALKPIDKFTVPGGDTAVPCLPHGLPPRRAGRAARRCEIRCGFHGARLAQPPVGLFLSAGSYAHGVLRRAGDPVDSLTRIPFRPQHVASSAPGFPVREVSPCTEIGRFVLSSLPYRQKQPEIGLLLSDGITREVYRTINILPR